MCVYVKSVIIASIGDDFLLDNYVNAAISSVRVLKRLPKDSRVPLAESHSDKMIDIFSIVENFTYWLVFLTSFFLEQHNLREVVVSKRQL